MSGHSIFLDVLRTLAVSLVVLRHGVSVPNLEAPDSPALAFGYRLAHNGWLGVDLFFVLSGFLISTQIIRDATKTDGFQWRRFLLRRALRTLPAYYFVLVLLWVGFLAVPLDTPGVGDLLVLGSHLFFLHDYLQPTVLITMWSLATEEKFYLLMALFAPLLVRARGYMAPISVGLIAAGIIAFRSVGYFDDPPTSYPEYFWKFRAPFQYAIDGLLIGVLCGLISTRWRPEYDAVRVLVPFSLALILVLLLCHGWASDQETVGVLFVVPLFSLSSAALILSKDAIEPYISTPWISRPAGWIAATSYSIYLAHYPVAKLAAAWHLTPGDGMNLGLYWVTYVLSTCAVGYALYLGVERSGLRFRERLQQRYFSPSKKCVRDSRTSN